MGRLTSFLIQAALVVAAVLVFSFFDPFGIFASKRQKLMDTPITVESIKEMGKFISAEYDGEVLSSLTEIEVQQLEENKDALQSLDSLFGDAITNLRESDERIRNKNHLLDTFYKRYPKVVKDTSYKKVYLNYLIKKYDEKKEKNIIEKLVTDKNISLAFNPLVLAELHKDERKQFIPDKKTLKKQLILLGRGTVKAGFDFEKFTEKNFKYDAAKGRIYLIGMKPAILSCSINPWFIPEKKVKGFEIVLYTKKANDPRLMNMVKEDCQEKLYQSALAADILGEAEKNAIQNLKLFFSLLLNRDDIEVVLSPDLFAYYKTKILDDSIVTGEDLSFLDSLITRADNKTLDLDTSETLERVRAFIDLLKTKKFYFRKKNASTLSCYSSIAYNISADSTVDSLEYKQLTHLNPTEKNYLPCEKYWFRENDSLNLLLTRKELFNKAIDDISKNTKQFIRTPSTKQKLIRNNSASANRDSQVIDSLFVALKK